jgi:hypothetical protein
MTQKGHETGGSPYERGSEDGAGNPAGVYGSGLREQVGCSHVGQYATCNAYQETEGLISGYGRSRGQSRREWYREPQQHRRTYHLSARSACGYEDCGQRDPDRRLVRDDTESDEPRGNFGCFGADTQHETVGKIVDRQPQDERPERALANPFL